MSEEYKSSRSNSLLWAIKFIGIAALLYIGPSLVAIAVHELIRQWYFDGVIPKVQPMWFIAVVAGIDTILRAVGAIWLAVKFNKNEKIIHWRPPTLLQIGYTILIWGQYILGLVIATSLADHLFSSFNASQEQDLGFSTVQNGANLILVFLLLVVIVPFCEEVVFRGYIYGKLKTKLSIIPSAIITSVLFGLAHGQWNVGIDTALLSIAAIYLVEKHKTIWTAILLHMIKNCLAFVFVFLR